MKRKQLITIKTTAINPKLNSFTQNFLPQKNSIEKVNRSSNFLISSNCFIGKISKTISRTNWDEENDQKSIGNQI